MPSTDDVWARDVRVGPNKVRQLLVRGSDDVVVRESEDGAEQIVTPFGIWSALRTHNAVIDDGPLTAVLPVSEEGRISWIGDHAPSAPGAVLRSYEDAIAFTRHDRPNSLRRPQLAALHSILGYQASGLTDPATVVMPTGTGKTETMLAWMVAARPTKLLVIVPSNALRDQLASKFETLGVLQQLGIVANSALRPCVGTLKSKFNDEVDLLRYVAAANVVVSTVNAIQANEPGRRAILYEQFTHLIVDEAHHAPADTWTEILRGFDRRPVLLFTATPFRRDGRALPGRMIFRFPLREAQKDKHFSQIEFTAVLDLDKDDEPLARAALQRLRSDLDKGYEHILLARVRSTPRADEVHALYSHLAPELNPTVLYNSMSVQGRKEALQAIRSGTSRVIVCVDMLGEGFDLPTLKVGAFHDPYQSLSPMIQLIGRLARTNAPVPIGGASVFVRQDADRAFSPMRDLLREDPDWNSVLSDVTEREAERAEQISTFEASFVDVPFDVPVSLLEPKMSAIAFDAPVRKWDPQAARQVYGETILDDLISTSADGDVAWFIIESISDLRWGDVPSLRTVNYSLVVMHLDHVNSLLYVHGSDTKRKYDDLAELVLGREPQQLKGYDTFRVFSGLDRIIPTNIGLLDARDRDKRFSMHVGSNVETALSEAEKAHKANTHIAAKAVNNGQDVTICASLGGRFWSMRSAPNLTDWIDWCREQGKKLHDGKIDVHSLFRDMIIPIAVTERPPYPFLAMEWPWGLYLGTGTATKVSASEQTVNITDAELRVDDYSETGPLRFSVVLPDFEAPYEATFSSTGVHYRARGPEKVEAVNGHNQSVPLSAWLNNHKPTLFLSGDRMITGDDRLLAPREDVRPYPRDALRTLDWAANDVNIRVESQGPERRSNSIQAYVARHLQQAQTFDVLIDDDRSGEAADLVGLRVQDGDLIVTLVHCKFSTKDKPGGRLADLYEVCGQAMRGARWRDKGAIPLIDHLRRRVALYERRTGVTAFEVGDREKLHRIREQAPRLFPRLETLVVQPGLSVAQSTNEQLRLIAGAASYVGAVTKGGFQVYGSA